LAFNNSTANRGLKKEKNIYKNVIIIAEKYLKKRVHITTKKITRQFNV
jgi:hypothetical protein